MELQNIIYNIVPGLIVRKIGDHIVIIPVESQNEEGEVVDSVFTLNDTAAGIWTQINGSISLEDIKGKIVDYFGISLAQAEEDLLTFILQAEEAGLVFCNKEEA